ncbi:MAG TPA: hypothetical protein VMH86_12435 [Rhizomicrobium sp.]|nr:hypothetical protein [Rhizomicrobium sp.]
MRMRYVAGILAVAVLLPASALAGDGKCLWNALSDGLHQTFFSRFSQDDADAGNWLSEQNGELEAAAHACNVPSDKEGTAGEAMAGYAYYLALHTNHPSEGA